MEVLIFGGAYVRRGICVSKSIGLALVGSKFTVFALFYFLFEDNVKVQAPGGLIFRGAISCSRTGFLCYEFEGFIFGGVINEGGGGGYFRNFTVSF